MRISRKKIIELCIELWTWCAETGSRKEYWPGWDKYSLHVNSHCWFCYFDNYTTEGYERISGGECLNCPYYQTYGHCSNKGTFYDRWDDARTPRIRKKYAKLFLEQIKKID